MRDPAPYLDHDPRDEADFWGQGEPPAVTQEKECRGCRGRMRVAISTVMVGSPPIASWGWECRSCGRTEFGGRWVE